VPDAKLRAEVIRDTLHASEQRLLFLWDDGKGKSLHCLAQLFPHLGGENGVQEEINSLSAKVNAEVRRRTGVGPVPDPDRDDGMGGMPLKSVPAGTLGAGSKAEAPPTPPAPPAEFARKRATPPSRPAPLLDAAVEQVLAWFRAHPRTQMRAGEVPCDTSDNVKKRALALLASRGEIEKVGRLAGTRYRLAGVAAEPAPPPPPEPPDPPPAASEEPPPEPVGDSGLRTFEEPPWAPALRAYTEIHLRNLRSEVAAAEALLAALVVS
jgi:hypothetical protein